jgi:hypothetical protein
MKINKTREACCFKGNLKKTGTDCDSVTADHNQTLCTDVPALVAWEA